MLCESLTQFFVRTAGEPMLADVDIAEQHLPQLSQIAFFWSDLEVVMITVRTMSR